MKYFCLYLLFAAHLSVTLQALLENDGSQAIKQRGLRVIRAVVTKTSSLIGKRVSEVDFRKTFKAAIIAIQKGGRNVSVSSVVFGSGDIIVLQTDEDSPLLKVPSPDFYKRLTDANKDIGTGSRSSSVASFVNLVTKTLSHASLDKLHKGDKGQDTDIEMQKPGDKPKFIDGTDAADADRHESDSDDGLFFIGGHDSIDGNNPSVEESEVVITDMVSFMIFGRE